jgi:hypothetical protein
VSQRHRHRGRTRRDAPEPLYIANVVDAYQFVFALPELDGDFAEALAIIRHDHRVTRIIFDPLIEGKHRVLVPRGRPVLERGDERVLHVVTVPELRPETPPDDLVANYEAIRKACANLGHPLIDLFLTDGEAAQSMSLALDPNSPWLHDDPPSVA